MKIKIKIILLVTGLIFFLTISGLVTFYKFAEITHKLSEIASQNVIISNKIVNLNLQHIGHTELFKKVIEKGILLQSNQIEVSEYDSAKLLFSNSCMRFDQDIKGNEISLNDPHNYLLFDKNEQVKIHESYASIIISHDICSPMTVRVFSFLEAGRFKDALPLADTFYENEKKISKNLSDVLSYYSHHSTIAINQTGESQKNILWQLFFLIAIISGIGILVAIFLVRGILTSLNKAVWVAHEIEIGKREINFGVFPIDEIGELLQTMKKMLRALLESENTILKEKKKSDELLMNILPQEVAEELKNNGSAEAKLIDNVTVLFTDFKGFTQLSEKLSPQALVAEINGCFSAFDIIMQKHGVEKIKTIGDAYMAAGGVPTPNNTHAKDVVKAAVEIQQYMLQHKAERVAKNELFFEIRIGVHTGPVVAGIVGIKKFQYDIWGDTVNIASRMESSGEINRVNISESTYELVKDDFNCEYRGEIIAKNKGAMKMYFVV